MELIMAQDCITKNKLDEIEKLLGELQLSPKNRGEKLQDQLETIAEGLDLSNYLRGKLAEAINYASNRPEQHWIESSDSSFYVFKSRVTIT
jgi:hypothetical protein